LKTGGGTLGTPGQDLRAKAFGYLAMGCQQGYLAMVYDSGGIVTVGMPSAEIPELSAASELMKEAIKNLDSAVVVAGQAAATGTGGFPTPEAWLGGKAFSRDDFVKLARSYRARFRAGVARTKAQRDAVDWAAVVADAGGRQRVGELQQARPRPPEPHQPLAVEPSGNGVGQLLALYTRVRRERIVQRVRPRRAVRTARVWERRGAAHCHQPSSRLGSGTSDWRHRTGPAPWRPA
jgi:hypothetical protein